MATVKPDEINTTATNPDQTSRRSTRIQVVATHSRLRMYQPKALHEVIVRRRLKRVGDKNEDKDEEEQTSTHNTETSNNTLTSPSDCTSAIPNNTIASSSVDNETVLSTDRTPLLLPDTTAHSLDNKRMSFTSDTKTPLPSNTIFTSCSPDCKVIILEAKSQTQNKKKRKQPLVENMATNSSKSLVRSVDRLTTVSSGLDMDKGEGTQAQVEDMATTDNTLPSPFPSEDTGARPSEKRVYHDFVIDVTNVRERTRAAHGNTDLGTPQTDEDGQTTPDFETRAAQLNLDLGTPQTDQDTRETTLSSDTQLNELDQKSNTFDGQEIVVLSDDDEDDDDDGFGELDMQEEQTITLDLGLSSSSRVRVNYCRFNC